MRKLVADASIVLKWIPGKGEKGVEEAREIYRQMAAGEVEIWAPSFLLIEVANILIKKRKVAAQKASKGILRLGESGIKFREFETQGTEKLIEIMGSYNVTAYDALYLWLARESRCRLVTADKKLLAIEGLVVEAGEVVEDSKVLN